MKTSHLALLLAGTVLAADPQPRTDPHAEARQAVQTVIVARLSPKLPPFSRLAPPMPMLQYQEPQLVDGEQRLPFTVTMLGRPADTITGYVRLSDRAIFLLDPKTKRYRPSSLDPRFPPLEEKAGAEKPA